ncbi:MAG: hypothetical protein RQ728_06410 [Brevefilum sp.]|nr:hypothetical protein [Brevefilum sp.]MDT8381872.1 hypothetical protein [Brevefilum sp.]MDW7754955.1 hypothetical protein [Brevefilum sp.]
MLLILSACSQKTPEPGVETSAFKFEPKLTMYEPGKVVFKLGITNTSNSDQTKGEDADICGVVTDEDGEIRNQMTIVERPKISSGETVFPLTYEAIYDPGSYTMSISGEGVPPLSVSFEIRDIEGLLKLAVHPGYIDPHTGFTIDVPDL